MKTKSMLQIDIQFNRLWLNAERNKERRNKLAKIWHDYHMNILESEIIKNLPYVVIGGNRMVAVENTQLPRKVYAGY